jgi:hypothetical protein
MSYLTLKKFLKVSEDRALYIPSDKHCGINDTKDKKYSSPFLDFDTRRENLASGPGSPVPGTQCLGRVIKGR